MMSVNKKIICKGTCGKADCPVCIRLKAMYKAKPVLLKDNFFGSTPNIFVGRFGYPNVNVGILSPTENLDTSYLCDAPKEWANSKLKIPDIIDLRARLVNSRTNVDVKKKIKFLDVAKETAMSIKPVDVEVNLEKKPIFSMNYEQVAIPMGSNARIKSAEITENVNVKKKVQKAVDETDVNATKAINSLDKSGYDEYFLTKLLSAGNVGIGANRKLVPTRYAITAVDDLISKEHLKEIKTFNVIENYEVYYANNLGNHYIVILLPDVFSYELFETYLPESIWNDNSLAETGTDFETYDGRTTYAENCTGGYYAARIAITKKLLSMKKQATVLVFRFITDEYFAPLGVWNCRETTKMSLESKPVKFSDINLSLKYVWAFVKKKFGYDINELYKVSKILAIVTKQKKLHQFS
ncbi:MAG: hypothetical protein WC755_04400 [Candidatus Woesearchaeota archaeon]|jgi:hypothetical protein